MYPTEKIFRNEDEITNYLHGKFFRCVSPFLSWMKRGESYWFEHHTDGKYEVRSDNNLGQKFYMSDKQLMTCFFPTELEDDIAGAVTYGYWLADHGVYHDQLDGILNYYNKK